jgi:acid phosphatase class B
MRKAVVSLVAVMLFAAVFAMPANAAGATGEKIKSITLSLPTTGTAGGDLEGTATLSLADASVFGSRTTSFQYQVIAVAGIYSDIKDIRPGQARYLLNRAAAKRVPTGITKTGTFTWTINPHVERGDYTVFLVAKVPGETIALSHTIRID